VRFYTAVLDFIEVLNVGYGRICMHPATGFVLGLARPEGARSADRSPSAARGWTTSDSWPRRGRARGMAAPIRQAWRHLHPHPGHGDGVPPEFFRDPDGIALEFDAPNELALEAQRALASGQTSPETIAAFVTEHFGLEYVPGRH
jgi:hypothetical protein